MNKSQQKSSGESTAITRKWWFWVLIVVGALVVISALSSGDQDSGGEKVGENSSSTSQEGNDNSSREEEKTEFVVGDVIAFDGKEITVVSIKRKWTAKYRTPSSGKEYVKVTVKIENKSSDQVSFNTYDWKMQDAGGAIESAAAATYSLDDSLSSGEIAAGGRKTGSLVFEVPTNDTDLQLHYQPSFWSDKKVIIRL